MTIPVVSGSEWALFADERRGAEFRATLKRERNLRRWSQERLATEAEMDHSLVSRLESGQRTPTREALGKLAAGLELDRERTEELFLSAGLLPGTIDAEDLRRAVALLRGHSAAEIDLALVLIATAPGA